MIKNGIQILHLKYVTIAESATNFLSFDSKAGDKLQEIVCISTLGNPLAFLADLETQKIVKLIPGTVYGSIKDKLEYSTFSLSPMPFYTNRKFEDILLYLFEKHNL